MGRSLVIPVGGGGEGGSEDFYNFFSFATGSILVRKAFASHLRWNFFISKLILRVVIITGSSRGVGVGSQTIEMVD